VEAMMTVDEEAFARCSTAYKLITKSFELCGLTHDDAMSVIAKILCELSTEDIDEFMMKMEMCYIFYNAIDEIPERKH
jgi:hypothetical protein